MNVMCPPGLCELQVCTRHLRLGFTFSYSPKLLFRCDKIRCDGSRLVNSLFTTVGVYFRDGKLTAMLITTLVLVGDVQRRDLRQHNVSTAASLVGAPGYDVKKANRAVGART